MICKQCNEEFERLGSHWYASSQCDFPNFTHFQHSVITGLLMGDACIDNSTGNPSIVINMTNKNFLQHLDKLFGNKSSGVSFMRSGKEQAKHGRFSDNPENYSDQYRWKSRTNPKLSEYRDWYKSGEKIFPKGLELDETVLKYWYVCDGTYDTSGHHKRISIAASNEIDNEKKIRNYFNSANIPEPSGWNTSVRESGGRRCNIYWTNEDTEILFDYMGDKLPGFEYKWP